MLVSRTLGQDIVIGRVWAFIETASITIAAPLLNWHTDWLGEVRSRSSTTLTSPSYRLYQAFRAWDCAVPPIDLC